MFKKIATSLAVSAGLSIAFRLLSNRSHSEN